MRSLCQQQEGSGEWAEGSDGTDMVLCQPEPRPRDTAQIRPGKSGPTAHCPFPTAPIQRTALPQFMNSMVEDARLPPASDLR